MMKQTKLAKAVAYAIAGVTLSAGSISVASAEVTTMYNLTTAAGEDISTNTTDPTSGGSWAYHRGGTDGWIYGFDTDVTDPNDTPAKWAGTSAPHSTPFGYAGAHLNWAIEMTGGKGGKGEISTFDAFNRYGMYADIDTAKGAWSDASTSGAAGWLHDLEYGLFRSDTSGTVTLNAQGILQSGTNFGFTIFKGMSTNSHYDHHKGWNATNNIKGITPLSLPSGGGITFTVSDIVAYSVGGNDPQNLNTISFDAESGQIYTIVLGGYRNGKWVETTDGYRLNVSQVSHVPLPGAVWLFGSALVGMVGLRRRKSTCA